MDDSHAQLGLLALGCAVSGYYLLSSTATSKKKKKYPDPPPADFTPFDDPTSTPFDAARWELVRSSDSDVEWIHTGAAVAGAHPPPAPFNRNVSVIAPDLLSRPAAAYAAAPFSSSSQFHRAAMLGADFYAQQARGRGCVPNDYGGPLFLLPGLIIAAYVCREEAKQRVLPREHRAAMAQYILNHQQEDGGWGTHISSTSTSFGSVLNYVALRLLGVPATHASCAKARAFLAVRGGGAHGAPLWAKLWLCTLGLYSYEALPSSVPPEMFLLPDWFPFHPGKTWCHARMVALPMAYLYGKRFVYPLSGTDPTIAQLRLELYPCGGEQSMFSPLATGETYPAPPSLLLQAGDVVLRRVIEPLVFIPLRLRDWALARTLALIREEDETNEYICIGPVNKALNMVCRFAAGDAEAVHKHADTMYRYLWLAEDGMKMNGYVNSMVWDSSFALRALVSLRGEESSSSSPALDQFADDTLAFLLRNQVDKDPSATQQYRDPHCRGGWGFSTKENTYIVSDCTGEALLAVLVHAPHQCIDTVLGPAVDLILWMQNEDDGAWASYEKRRGYAWYEALNPTAMFDNIMIDYSYVECTSSCVQALVAYINTHSTDDAERAAKCRAAVDRALPFLFHKQREDGSWFGEWGVCFLYAGFFATEALAAYKLSLPGAVHSAQVDAALQRAVVFTLSKQNEADGGWGESVESCALKTWVQDPAGSNVVGTAWAVLSLCGVLRAGSLQPGSQVEKSVRMAVRRGALYLVQQQEHKASEDPASRGDWPQQSMISGVFNKTCGITYTAYRNVFPIWALAEAGKLEKQD